MGSESACRRQVPTLGSRGGWLAAQVLDALSLRGHEWLKVRHLHERYCLRRHGTSFDVNNHRNSVERRGRMKRPSAVGFDEAGSNRRPVDDHLRRGLDLLAAGCWRQRFGSAGRRHRGGVGTTSTDDDDDRAGGLRTVAEGQVDALDAAVLPRGPSECHRRPVGRRESQHRKAERLKGLGLCVDPSEHAGEGSISLWSWADTAHPTMIALRPRDTAPQAVPKPRRPFRLGMSPNAGSASSH